MEDTTIKLLGELYVLCKKNKHLTFLDDGEHLKVVITHERFKSDDVIRASFCYKDGEFQKARDYRSARFDNERIGMETEEFNEKIEDFIKNIDDFIVDAHLEIRKDNCSYKVNEWLSLKNAEEVLLKEFTPTELQQILEKENEKA